LGIRPQDVSAAEGPDPKRGACLLASAERIGRLGNRVLLYWRIGSFLLQGEAGPTAKAAQGELALVTLNLEQSYLFDQATGKVLSTKD
jgi:hypothetical protein